MTTSGTNLYWGRQTQHAREKSGTASNDSMFEAPHYFWLFRNPLMVQ